MTPLERAQDFAHQHGWNLQALHSYENPRFWMLRMRHPDWKKEIRPMRETEAGFYAFRLPEFPRDVRPLYRLDVVHVCPSRPILLVEGENCADVLNALGSSSIAAVSWPGGAGSLARVDLSPLALRCVMLWPDNDAIGMEAMQEAETRLRGLGCDTHVVNLAKLKLPSKGDVVDLMASSLGKDKRDVTGTFVDGLSEEKKLDLIQLVENNLTFMPTLSPTRI